VLVLLEERDAEDDVEDSLEVDDKDLPVEALVREPNVVEAVLLDEEFVIEIISVLSQPHEDEDWESKDPDKEGGEGILHDRTDVFLGPALVGEVPDHVGLPLHLLAVEHPKGVAGDSREQRKNEHKVQRNVLFPQMRVFQRLLQVEAEEDQARGEGKDERSQGEKGQRKHIGVLLSASNVLEETVDLEETGAGTDQE